MRRRTIGAWCVVVLMGWGWCAVGAEPALPEVWLPGADWWKYVRQEPTDETRRLARELMSGDFAVRERATGELTSKGIDGYPGIEKLTAGDVEAAAAPRRAEKNPPLSMRVRALVAAGKLNEAQEAFEKEMTGRTGEMADYAAFLALRHGADFDPAREWEALAAKPWLKNASNTSTALGMWLYRAKGDAARAADYAEKLPPDYGGMPEAVFIAARRWGGVGRSNASYPPAVVMREALEGHREKADAILEGWMSGAAKPPSAGLMQVAVGYEAADRTEDSLKVLTRIGLPLRQFQILSEQLRLREALALVPPNGRQDAEVIERLMDLQLTGPARWLVERVPVRRNGDGTMDAEAALERASLLARLGNVADAEKLRADALAQTAAYETTKAVVDKELQEARAALVQVSRRGAAVDAQTQLRVTEAYQETLKRVQAMTRGAQRLGFYRDELIRTDDMLDDAQYWLEAVRKEKLDAAATYRKVRRILRGEITVDEGRALIDYVIHAHGKTNAMLDELEPLTDALHRSGHDELLSDAVARWEELEQNPECWVIAGDVALVNHKPETAFVAYFRAAAVAREDPAMMYRMGLALVRGQAAPEVGRQLMAYAPLLALADLEQARQLANVMRRFEGKEAGDRWFDDFYLRFSGDIDNAFWETFARGAAIAEARGDLKEALVWQMQACLAGADPRAPVMQTMRNWAAFHRLRALEAAGRGDFQTAGEAVEGTLRNGPPDVELLEKVMPGVKRTDGAAAARILGVARERLKAVVEDYPEMERFRGELERVEALAR